MDVLSEFDRAVMQWRQELIDEFRLGRNTEQQLPEETNGMVDRSENESDTSSERQSGQPACTGSGVAVAPATFGNGFPVHKATSRPVHQSGPVFAVSVGDRLFFQWFVASENLWKDHCLCYDR